MRPLVPNLANLIARQGDILACWAYFSIVSRLRYTKNAFVAIFSRFLGAFYTLEESFK